MIRLLLNSIALDPNRWTAHKTPHFRLDQLLDPISRTGFRYVELWQYHLFHEPEATIRQFLRIGTELGLAFPVTGMYPQLHLQGGARVQEMQKVDRMLDYSMLMGTNVVKLFVGNRASAVLSETEYANSVAFMQELAEQARQREMIIAGETHGNTIFDDLTSCKRFRSDVSADNFKICFQPYDFTNTARAINDFKALGKDIVHFHLQGRRNDEMVWLSRSDLDYDALLTAILTEGYEGDLSIEFVKDCVVPSASEFDLNTVLANARRDRDFILQIADRAGVAIAG